MQFALKKLATEALKKLDLRLARYSYIQSLEGSAKLGSLMEMLLKERYTQNVRLGMQDDGLLRALRNSQSQLGQDIFVLLERGFATAGYFVEFGAANGVSLSNTYLLEKEFGWRGIVAEPAARWQQDLKGNRNCHIESKCVWRDSNSVLTFNEADEGEYSTIDAFRSSDIHYQMRTRGTNYSVTTLSLEDMLNKYNAPRSIDYLSIDTEGTEFEILSAFDFSKYEFRVITCEHNFSQQRDKIFSLLTENGYSRLFEKLSRFDDWYVRGT